MLPLLLLHAWRIKETLRREIRVQPVKGRKTQEENANDLCRLRGVNLKIKFGHFQEITKHISMEDLVITKPSGHKKRVGTTLAELCLEIGLHIKESSVLSSRVLW